jgi:hypothetical protein
MAGHSVGMGGPACWLRKCGCQWHNHAHIRCFGLVWLISLWASTVLVLPYKPCPRCNAHIRCPTAKKAGRKLWHKAQGCALEGKLPLTHVARVCLAQHSVTVARHHFARLERVPHEFL